MNRIAKEDQVGAELDRLAINIRQARKVNRTIIALLLILAALLVGFNWPKPAEAASRPVFKGTVTICISPSKKSDPYGQYVNTMWNVKAAAKAAGVGSVRVKTERDPLTTCYGDVRVGSDTSAKSRSVYKLVDCWKGHCEIWESQVTMGDRWGKAHTAAQRKAELVKALKTAIPR